MKKLIYLTLAVLFLGLPSYAGPTIQMLNDSVPSYTMMILEDGFAGYSAGDIISTFCVEKNEYFTPGGSYYAAINTAAVSGGVSGGNPDPLDQRSAYLYTQFLSGNSAFQNQSLLQDAIWYIEGEITSTNSYVGLANTAVNSGAWAGLGNIRIANLYTLTGGFAQDQLISINPVPVPGALVLSGIGTVMVGWFRRRVK